jgi:DNA-binding transcriptional MerR regulator
MSTTGAELTIGAVAQQTNLAATVLRSWEVRYGFPMPERSPSGHRRYTARQVEQIRTVVRHRDDGMSLEAAIRRIRSSSDVIEPSIFAGLRRRWPILPVHVLSTRAMHAVSKAIEDECCAQAERPVLIGCFQREWAYRRSEARWRELSRTAWSATVFADFGMDRHPPGGPREVALAADSPLRREWAVVCDAPGAAGCLAGFERLDDGRSVGERRFEAVWSVDPAVVRDAADIGAALAGDGADQRRPAGSVAALTDPAAIVRRATAVTNRVIAYIDL